MTYEELMLQLEKLGSEQTKRTFLRHGAMEPFFGVKVGDLKKLVKYVKKDQKLAEQLYASGISDAMYLAGLSIDPKQVSKELLQQWANEAYWSMLSEYTVAGVAAESAYARELALEWMDSPEEMKAACGWNTYAGYVSITPDSELPIGEIRELLARVRRDIHSEKNRARYTMNGFVIAVGTYVRELHEEAIDIGKAIGEVHVDVGNTACKVPLAEEYIAKSSSKGKIGVKKKTCIC
ncbi:DNA alkylation repair protein [Paenibacillus sp. 1011MAR3C5]|uniref:DNA alkylation repair protein n=1 Tax=Paenibacillus sp. 1011MAR3C5 TaxID=1675787 RepID=UPI000E6CA1C3|nr:DNA alkylation repair protein [Paenibacillus sp. 1011MAR3C5]RJE91217.1 DNA alkylation repair protein [Paenibacillus sp. 1011MAR3C5]